MIANWIRRSVRYAAVALVAFLVVRIFFGSAGIAHQYQLGQENRTLQHQIDSLQTELSRRRTEILLLKVDSFHLESLARTRLGMSRPGERIYQFIDEDSPAKHDSSGP